MRIQREGESLGWLLGNSKRGCPEYGDAFEKSKVGSWEEALAQDWDPVGDAGKGEEEKEKGIPGAALGL